MSEKIRVFPCPFCGGHPQVFFDEKTPKTMIICANHADHVHFRINGDSPEEAARLWNTRYELTRSSDRVCWQKKQVRYDVYEDPDDLSRRRRASRVNLTCGHTVDYLLVESCDLNFCPECGRVILPKTSEIMAEEEE